jgi:hypothetical protein
MTPDPRIHPYANLRGTVLCGTVLSGADLNGAILCGTVLRGADLRDADLRGADLRDADLRGADLRDADLSGANLSGADLCDADLSGANLRRADLRGADLRGADLYGANLSGTCLDPTALPRNAYTAIAMAGLEIDAEGWVWGWRTARSLLVGATVYVPREEPYEAPEMSVCTDTSCHPGIYFASRAELELRFAPLVRCRARVEETHVVSRAKGARTKRLWIVAGDAS